MKKSSFGYNGSIDTFFYLVNSMKLSFNLFALFLSVLIFPLSAQQIKTISGFSSCDDRFGSADSVLTFYCAYDSLGHQRNLWRLSFKNNCELSDTTYIIYDSLGRGIKSWNKDYTTVNTYDSLGNVASSTMDSKYDHVYQTFEHELKDGEIWKTTCYQDSAVYAVYTYKRDRRLLIIKYENTKNRIRYNKEHHAKRSWYKSKYHGAKAYITKYKYDKAGNLIRMVDKRGRKVTETDNRTYEGDRLHTMEIHDMKWGFTSHRVYYYTYY